MRVTSNAVKHKNAIRQAIFDHFYQVTEGHEELHNLNLSHYGVTLEARDWDLDIARTRARKNIAKPTVENILASGLWNAVNTRLRNHKYRTNLVTVYHAAMKE
jgi:hypothetical protein